VALVNLNTMDSAKIHVAMLGTPEHEGRMCGRAFDILEVEPSYIDPRHPVIPSAPIPDVILLSREWSVDLRHAAIQARRQGIPVVYIMDGVIEWAYMWQNWEFVKPEGTVLQPLIASDLCVIGRHPARILATLGLADRIHIVGMPRLDGLKRQRFINQDSRPKFVIATAKTFGTNVAHKVFVRAGLRDVKAWFEQHPEIEARWRVDPQLAAELGVPSWTEGSLIDELRSANGLISFTSTVLLEAMVVGIPTAQIDYRSVPQYVQTAWEIRSPEHIEGVVHELLHPKPEKLAFQEACLRDELEVGDASSRFADVIRALGNRTVMNDKVEDKRESNSIGQFDFRQIHSHLSSFSVSPLSRLQYELDATYALWERDRRSLKTECAKIREDWVLSLLQRLTWLPGFKRTARLIKHLAGLGHD
jgi:hypothetical protein